MSTLKDHIDQVSLSNLNYIVIHKTFTVLLKKTIN